MIIFGTRGVTSTRDQGSFHCPSCGSGHGYRLRVVRRFFTLYFIPLIPMNQLGDHVECQSCKGTFHSEVLQHNPEAEGRRIQAQFVTAMRDVMLAMVLADGQVDDAEVALVRSILSELSNTTWSESDLRSELDRVRRERTDAAAVAKAISPSLNSSGAELVLTAAVRIAAADGEIAEEEMAQLVQIGESLGLSKHHFTGVISGITNEAAVHTR